MTWRSSVSICRAQSRTSSSGCANSRSSSASNAWPVPNRPTFDVVAAGSSPRSVSSALARMTERYTASESSADFGYFARKWASITGIQRAYVSNARSSVCVKRSRSGERATSTGTWYFHRPFGLSVYGTYRVDCSRYAIKRPHSSTFVRMFDTPSHATCAPPSCATESSPYSLSTRA